MKDFLNTKELLRDLKNSFLGTLKILMTVFFIYLMVFVLEKTLYFLEFILNLF